MYAYNFAAAFPDRVACIYGDTPVCDFKSWPGGKGKGKGSPDDWAALLRNYGFKDEAEALAYRKNPVDELVPLAAAKVALIHVVGDADQVVPPEENTLILESATESSAARSWSFTNRAATTTPTASIIRSRSWILSSNTLAKLILCN